MKLIVTTKFGQTFVAVGKTKFRIAEFEGGLEVMLYESKNGELALIVEPRVNNVVVLHTKRNSV
jgi:hypothetical protein